MRNSVGMPLGTETIRQVPIGAGGQITKISQSTDGATKVICADAYGAYVWAAADDKWRDLYLDTAIPSGLLSADGVMDGNYSDGFGCADAVVAPSSASTIFMFFDGYLLKSTNTGATFSQTNLPRKKYYAQSFGNKANSGHMITIDPNNVNAQLVGSPEGGVHYTIDGSTYTAVSTGDTSAENDQSGRVAPILTACDPTSTQSGGIRQRWFYAKYLTGVYMSTTGPNGTFSALAGSPVNLTSCEVDTFGTLWVTKYGVTNNVWKWTAGGGWVNVNIHAGYQFFRVVVDPNNASRIVAASGADYFLSLNGGTSWTHYTADLGNDPPQQITRERSIRYLDIGPTKQYHPVANQMIFDRAVPSRLWAAHGSGIVYTDSFATAGAQILWIGVGEGIEELVSHTVCAIPGGKRLTGHWDMGAFDIQSLDRFINKQKIGVAADEAWSDLTLPPIIQQPCSHIDYAADNPDCVVFFQHGGWYNVPINAPHISVSLDGGETLQLLPLPNNKPAISVGGGSMAVGKMTGTGLPEIVAIWNCDAVPEYFDGTSWSNLNIPGIVNGDAGFEFNGNVFALAYFLNKHLVCYDKTAEAFYLYNYGTGQTPNPKGIWKSTGGNVWTKKTGTLPITTTGGAVHLRSVPGHAGHLFLTAGESVNESLFRSNDEGANWSAVTTNGGQTVKYVTDVGLGMAAPGKSYPTIFYWGAVGATFGRYRSDDNLVTSIYLGKYFNHRLDFPMVVVGDPDVYGRVWYGLHGRGVAVGDYSHELTLAA